MHKTNAGLCKFTIVSANNPTLKDLMSPSLLPGLDQLLAGSIPTLLISLSAQSKNICCAVDTMITSFIHEAVHFRDAFPSQYVLFVLHVKSHFTGICKSVACTLFMDYPSCIRIALDSGRYHVLLT